MPERQWKVGALAKQSGVTVRTLHYYDEIGLLSPSMQTESGHRLYTNEDVGRLYQVLMLKRLGFALEDIKSILDHPDTHPAGILSLQLERLDQQIEAATRLRLELAQMAELVQRGSVLSGSGMLRMMQMMNMLDSPYFEPGQAAELKWRIQHGHSSFQHQYAEGEQLLAAFKQAMQTGKRPDDPAAQVLAEQWLAALRETGGDRQELMQAAEQYYSEHPAEAVQYGMSAELYDYIRTAVAHLHTGEN
ncbi:MerR family transcriptional regulator [Paenibacillus sp. 1P07SE]|uniref:MerR family transcriptional regulator n=1 Tax=Paenibacillus sp. 1P07SE TaxID=3132209 RepID=UPI0039A54D23